MDQDGKGKKERCKTVLCHDGIEREVLILFMICLLIRDMKRLFKRKTGCLKICNNKASDDGLWNFKKKLSRSRWELNKVKRS